MDPCRGGHYCTINTKPIKLFTCRQVWIIIRQSVTGKGGGGPHTSGRHDLTLWWLSCSVHQLLEWSWSKDTESVSSIKANMTELMVQFSGEYEEIPPLIDSCSCRQQRTHTLTLTSAPLLLIWKVEYRYRYFYDFCVSEGFFKTQ